MTLYLIDYYYIKELLRKIMLRHNFLANNNSLIYWESGNQAEIDFLLYNDDGIIPIEVKANNNTSSKSLTVYMKRYNPKYAIRISTKNFGLKII